MFGVELPAENYYSGQQQKTKQTEGVFFPAAGNAEKLAPLLSGRPLKITPIFLEFF